MKVLFIGGTGLISQAASKLAVEKGIDLYLLNRGQRNDFVPDGAHVITADIRDAAATAEALKHLEFDAVVDWIAFTPDHVATDIKLFKGKTAQYIFISSASAYQKPSTQYLVTESTPLANPYWQYSRDKIACEDLLMDTYRSENFPITIVRPSYTYGDTMIPAALNSWANPWSLVDRMRKGEKIIVHGDGTSLWTMTHNTDFAKGIVGLLGNPKAIGHAFHITSDEVLDWNQITHMIGQAAGVEPNIVHISSEFITSFMPESIGGLLGDKAVSSVFDNSKIKRFVPDYIATVPFHEGIKRTINWFELRPEKCKIDQGWNDLMDRISEAHEAGRQRAKG
ncbi:SDR family oxidoreductase [Paenibacillus agricola]|uniref:SDR family oxidoreductase n=1 Tax=Paenibacillus agricola TaxID=2716264 RepID=A0ABX0IZ55_9BACL|nr:SDR family oxidoreductase [Paenibacillus agricola]NHN29162.1 SDR family oxidoreductase [Paenibacillus agricola]